MKNTTKKTDNTSEIGEIKATIVYIRALNKVLNEKGLASAIGYELRSPAYSLGKRVANAGEIICRPKYSPSEFNYSEKEDQRVRRQVSDAQWECDNRCERRRSERIAYILRGE